MKKFVNQNLYLNITFENNHFENITNSITVQPMITLVGNNITARNNTFKNCNISTALSITAEQGGIIENMNFIEIIGSSKYNNIVICFSFKPSLKLSFNNPTVE